MTDEQAGWYVVRALPKRERAAGAYIQKMLGLEVVAPQVSYIKPTKRGKVLWREAMFPGYLFVKFVRTEMERGVCAAPGVMKLVKFGDYVPTIDEEFVLQLQEVIGEEGAVALERVVEVGGKYEVANGPLQGQEGEVVEVLPGGERVKMLLEFIGGERLVEVDLYSLLLSARPDMEES